MNTDKWGGAGEDSAERIARQLEERARKPQTAGIKTSTTPSARVKRKPEKKDRQKRFLFTASEDAELEELIHQFNRKTNSNALNLSYLVRACVRLATENKREILDAAAKVGELSRPSNHEPAEQDAFEETIARIVSDAFRQ